MLWHVYWYVVLFEPNLYVLCSYWTIEQGGAPVQQYYYVPRDILQAENTLVLGEELGVSDLSQVSVVLSTMVVPAVGEDSSVRLAQHIARVQSSSSTAAPRAH